MKKNCGQIQNMETILVIFIVTVIIAIAIGLFYNLQLKSLDSLKYNYQQNRAYNLLSTLPLSAELQYTELNYDKSSIDALKLLTSSPELKSSMKIEIQQIYPEPPKKVCTTSNYPDCSTYIIYNKPPITITSQESISTPVSLYHPLQGKKAFANLIITVYY